MTSAGQGGSAEGDATAARSRARESNQKQLKTELPSRGLPERGAFQRRSWGRLFSGSAPLPCCSPLSRGAGGGLRKKGSPLGLLCPSSCVLLLWPSCLPHRLPPLCRCGRGKVSADRGPDPQLSPTYVHKSLLVTTLCHWCLFTPCFTDEDTEAERGRESLLKATQPVSSGAGI